MPGAGSNGLEGENPFRYAVQVRPLGVNPFSRSPGTATRRRRMSVSTTSIALITASKRPSRDYPPRARGRPLLAVAQARKVLMEAWTMIPLTKDKAYLQAQRSGMLLHSK